MGVIVVMQRNVALKWLLIVAVLMASAVPLHAAAAFNGVTAGSGPALDLRDAMSRGIARDASVKDARSGLKKAETEWVQAQLAVMHQTDKDSGLFARPHSLSKDLEIRLKIPQARQTLAEARGNVKKKEQDAAASVRRLYAGAAAAELAEAAARRNWEAAEAAARETKALLKLARTDQGAVEEAEQALENAVSAYKVAQLSAKSAKLDLGKAIGLNVEKGYSFEIRPVYADLQEGAVWTYIDHAQRNDHELTTVSMRRALAEEKVKVTRQLYNNKFGAADMKIIEAMYNKPIDEELFMANYDVFLERVKKQWEGYIYFIFPIPKSLFQGEFDGIRYFDDIRYSLPVSMFEQDKARLAEQEQLEQLLSGVKTSFITAKTAEEGYAQALKKADEAKRAAASAAAARKLGKMTAQQQRDAEQAQRDAELLAAQSFLGYYLAIYQFNSDTSGAVEGAIRPGVLPWKAIDSGLNPLHDAPASAAEQQSKQGLWKLDEAVEPITATLRLAVPQQLGAVQYMLFSADKQPLTAPLPVDTPLTHLKLLFQSLEDAVVGLFGASGPIGIGSFEGIGSEGALAVGDVPADWREALENGRQAAGSAPGAGGSGEAGEGGDTLIIGTYKIDFAAFSKDVATAAVDTMTDSGQGMLFQSAIAGGAWVDLSKAMTPGDLLAAADGTGTASVSAAAVAAMKLTVEVKADGSVVSVLPTAELDKQIDVMKSKLAEIGQQQEKAGEEGDVPLVAALRSEADELAAELAYSEALRAGDVKSAAEKLSALAAIASGAPPASAEEQEAARKLEEQSAQAQQALDELLTSSAPPDAEVEAAAKTLAAAQQAQQLTESGVGAQLAALHEARLLLEEALRSAKAESDLARADALEQSLELLADAVRQEEKQALFVSKQAVEEVIGQLAAAGLKSEELNKQLAEIAGAIQAAELARYDELELQMLAEEAQLIIEEFGGQIVPLPVEQFISQDYDIKLDLPPVLVEGQAMIQIRPISESFGALVVWNSGDQSVTMIRGGNVVFCVVDQRIAYINGTAVELEVAPMLINGRTVVPLRFVADSLQIELRWNEELQTIQLSNKGDTGL